MLNPSEAEELGRPVPLTLRCVVVFAFLVEATVRRGCLFFFLSDDFPV
jgi:hypothetical protein